MVRLLPSVHGGNLTRKAQQAIRKDQPVCRAKIPKTEVVAFKVEAELAEFLNKLPNKSAFIRKAIAAQMSIACPLCGGTGTVNRAVHDHFAPLLQRFHTLPVTQLRWLRS